MRQAAAHLVGLHDFTTFRSSICQSASPVKTLDEIRNGSLDSYARLRSLWQQHRDAQLGRVTSDSIDVLDDPGAPAAVTNIQGSPQALVVPRSPSSRPDHDPGTRSRWGDRV